jgi:hypothetical protein
MKVANSQRRTNVNVAQQASIGIYRDLADRENYRRWRGQWQKVAVNSRCNVAWSLTNFVMYIYLMEIINYLGWIIGKRGVAS